MKIGLISDTHGWLDPKVLEHFSDCDEIWHAGDIGSLDLVKTLEAYRPFRAVFGNIDDKEMQSRFPEDLIFECEGFTVWMTHIGGAPPRYNPRVKKMLKSAIPDIFICGHSHILRVAKDPSLDGMLYINPGAAGNHGFHHMRTIIRMEIAAKQLKNMEVVELGRRGVLSGRKV